MKYTSITQIKYEMNKTRKVITRAAVDTFNLDMIRNEVKIIQGVN